MRKSLKQIHVRLQDPSSWGKVHVTEMTLKMYQIWQEKWHIPVLVKEMTFITSRPSPSKRPYLTSTVMYLFLKLSNTAPKLSLPCSQAEKILHVLFLQSNSWWCGQSSSNWYGHVKSRVIWSCCLDTSNHQTTPTPQHHMTQSLHQSPRPQLFVVLDDKSRRISVEPKFVPWSQ